mmetsp:Transcript_2198/g.4017  ORF Transcript_2198/g.4017 Transcript_2198/m.4017 type:complete len:262 (-) Transcript_2198:574-1359(-)
MHWFSQSKSCHSTASRTSSGTAGGKTGRSGTGSGGDSDGSASRGSSSMGRRSSLSTESAKSTASSLTTGAETATNSIFESLAAVEARVRTGEERKATVAEDLKVGSATTLSSASETSARTTASWEQTLLPPDISESLTTGFPKSMMTSAQMFPSSGEFRVADCNGGSSCETHSCQTRRCSEEILIFFATRLKTPVTPEENFSRQSQTPIPMVSVAWAAARLKLTFFTHATDPRRPSLRASIMTASIELTRKCTALASRPSL